MYELLSFQFSLVQSLSRVRLFVTPRITARQASLSITNSRSSLRLASIESACPLREIKMSDTCRLFPPFGDPWPSRLLPSQLQIVSPLGLLQTEGQFLAIYHLQVVAQATY